MFTLDIPSILQHSNPGAKWCVRGDQYNYASLEWMDEAPAPSEEDLQDAELAAAKAWRIAKSKREAQDRIFADYPIWKQANAAMGLYDAPGNQAVKDGVQAIRDDQAAAETAINALSDVEDILEFTW